MSVLRQQNWLGQQRIDVPHLRAVESSICADFDVLAGNILAGLTPVVIQGFEVVTTAAIGQPSTSLQVITANSICMHPNASDSGTIFQVPSSRATETLNAVNTRVKGGFTANTTNYVGFDMLRSADATTADLVQFLNPQTDLETPKDVPLGRTLDYVINISTQDFTTTPGLCPIAVIVTDTSNNVVSITDARNMMYRLGTGGSVPNATATYAWPGGRTELGTNADWDAADKSIHSLKDWMSSVMTRLWELGGGSYWYTPTNVFNVILGRSGTPFVSNGQYFEWSGTNLHWTGLSVIFDNTAGYFNTINNQTSDLAGLTNLADGQCIYVDIVRSSNATVNAVKGTLTSLGSPTIPGSRIVVAWRLGANIYTRNSDYVVNSAFAVATISALGVVKLHQASLTPANPVVLSDGDLNAASGVPALDANKQCSLTASGGNVPAFNGTGNGTGAGVSGTGGASGGTGVMGTGGATNGLGVTGQGTGTGTGVFGTGGSSAGVGVGGQGVGLSPGVTGTGGATSGAGVSGTGGAPNGIGVLGTGTGSGHGVSGVGGSGGNGIKGVGGGSGSGGSFTGGSTGNAVLAIGVNSSIVPTVQVNDSAANKRFSIDHIGYPTTASINKIEEYWEKTISYYTNPTTLTLVAAPSTTQSTRLWDRWTIPSTGSFTTILQGNGIASLTDNYVRIGAQSASVGAGANIGLGTGQFTYQAGSSFVIDFTLAVFTNSATWDFKVGLATQIAGSTTTENACCVYVTHTDYTKIYLYTNNNSSGTTTVSTIAVPFTLSGAVHCRLELHGASTPFGAIAVLYINDVQVASTSTTLPSTGSTMQLMLAAQTPAGGVANSIQVGPIRLLWNSSLFGYSM